MNRMGIRTRASLICFCTLAAGAFYAAPAQATFTTTQLGVTTAKDYAIAGASFNVVVIAKDASGKRVRGYRGKVSLTDDLLGGTLQRSHRFTAADLGRYTFKNVKLMHQNIGSLIAGDAIHTVSGRIPFTIIAGAPHHLDLDPSSAVIKPPLPTATAADFQQLDHTPLEQGYAVLEVDRFDNYIRDVTGVSTLSIGPDGSCSGPICTAAVPGPHTVNVTGHGFTGHGSLTVDTADNEYSMSCQGENYDVNGLTSDGCETATSPAGKTTSATAVGLGNFNCSGFSITRGPFVIPSDAREHSNPTVPGFDAVAGAAPFYVRFHADYGLFCTRSGAFRLVTEGGSASICYKLTVTTSLGSTSVAAPGAGNAFLPAVNIPSDSDVTMKVEKTCSAATPEAVTAHIVFSLD